MAVRGEARTGPAGLFSGAGGATGDIGSMAGTVVRVDGTEVALGDPKGGTVVNITLRQESAAAYLCKGAASLLRRGASTKEAAGRADHRRPPGGHQLVLGGVLILLGATCIGLGAILNFAPGPDYRYYYYNYFNRAFRNGVPFWMGGVFILSGASSVVGARHGGNWVHLATFLNLGTVVAGSVAFTLGLTDIPSPTHRPRFVDDLCERREEYRRYRPWEATTVPPSYEPMDRQRVRDCQEALWALVRMWISADILLLILHCVALAVAIFCFGYGLRRAGRSCWDGWKDYMAVEEADDDSPAPEEPNAA